MNPQKTLFFVFHGIMHLIIVAAAKQLPISRRAIFSIRENMRLKGHVVDSFNSPSLTSCSHSCLRNSWCSSTNFKKPSKENDQGTCELNQHGFLDEDAEFQDEQGVTYSMFLKVGHGKKLCSHVFSYSFVISLDLLTDVSYLILCVSIMKNLCCTGTWLKWFSHNLKWKSNY